MLRLGGFVLIEVKIPENIMSKVMKSLLGARIIR